MFAGTPQESLPVADNNAQISALSEQITHLRELIVVMVDLDLHPCPAHPGPARRLSLAARFAPTPPGLPLPSKRRPNKEGGRLPTPTSDVFL